MKKTKPKFAVAEIDGEDQLFVSVDSSGINPLCLTIDGIPMIFFGKSKKCYLAIDRAIQWYTNELKYCRKSESDRLQNNLKALENHKAAFERGDLIENKSTHLEQ